MRTKLQKLYTDYENRDTQAVLDALPDDFCFSWPTDANSCAYTGDCRGKQEFLAALQDLAESFEFNSYKLVDLIVEGNRAAAQLEANMTSNKTGTAFNSKISHFWTFEQGEPRKLVEYLDSALIMEHSPASM
jgi:ketosteroid isomerase-like protein